MQDRFTNTITKLLQHRKNLELLPETCALHSLHSQYYAEACNEWRDPSPRLSAWATQLRRNAAAAAVAGDTVSD